MGDYIAKVASYLPSGSFIVFSTVTNLILPQGTCKSDEEGRAEAVMTIFWVVLSVLGCFALSFTDSVPGENGEVIYVLVVPTKKGYVAQKDLPAEVAKGFAKGGSKALCAQDFVQAMLSAGTFAVLVLLTPPVSSCLFPHLPAVVLRAVPTMAFIIAMTFFNFLPDSRDGMGFTTGSAAQNASDLQAFKLAESADGGLGAASAAAGEEGASKPIVDVKDLARKALELDDKQLAVIRGALQARALALAAEKNKPRPPPPGAVTSMPPPPPPPPAESITPETPLLASVAT